MYFLLVASLLSVGACRSVIFLLLTLRDMFKLDPSFFRNNPSIVEDTAEVASFNCSRLTES